MSGMHQQVVEFVAEGHGVPRTEAHTKQFRCPVCTQYVKAINVAKHVERAHPQHKGALVCVAQTKHPERLLTHAS
jgi:hypothetical protein